MVDSDPMSLNRTTTFSKMSPLSSNKVFSVAEPLEELTSENKPTGVEVEAVGDANDAILEPFDPELIDVKTRSGFTIKLLATRLENSEIDLVPDFQRRAGIWDRVRKSRLIESLLLRIPLPVFYIAEKPDESWAVVDGLQRITTLKEFIVDETLSLNGLEFLTNHNGAKFGDLSRQMQRRIEETELTLHVIQPNTPPKVMFNIFKRINTGGMPLSSQEIRHALFQGRSTKLLARLAASAVFKNSTNSSINDERMADRECILRFFAFFVNDPQKYQAQDLDNFLTATMRQINGWGDSEEKKLVTAFNKGVAAAHRIFGRNAFRKYYGDRDRLLPVNKALFEVWVVHLANTPPRDIKRLEAESDEVLRRFSELCSDDEDFSRSISASTGDPRNVRYRFKAIKNLISGVLGD